MINRQKTGGRAKGTPNKVTAEVRAGIAAFAEANVGKLQSWLDAVAEKDPARALDLFVRLLEYHVPKLARTEVTQDAPEETETIKIVFADPRQRSEKS